jgi:hypothetical protein
VELTDKHRPLLRNKKQSFKSWLKFFAHLSWYVDAFCAFAACYQNVLCGIALLGTISLGNFNCMSINQIACSFNHHHTSIRENSPVYLI